jgi:hypothetical protein
MDATADDSSGGGSDDAGTADVATGSDATSGSDGTVTLSNDGSTGDAASGNPLDAGLDTGAEASGPWTPNSLTGLALWLNGHVGLGLSDRGVEPSDAGDAGVADAGPTLVWLDQSGHGNNATGYGSPSINATAIDGQPAVHFNGTTDYLLLQDSPSLQWNTGDFVLALVVRNGKPTDAGVPYGTLYSKQIADVSPYDGVGLFANTPNRTSALLAQLNANAASELTTSSTGYNDDTPFLVVLHRALVPLAPLDGGSVADAGDAGGVGDAGVPPVASLDLLINGADAGSSTGTGYAGNVSAAGYVARIGGTQGGQDLEGDIAEVIGVQGSVSDADLASLQEYLRSKYGL